MMNVSRVIHRDPWMDRGALELVEVSPDIMAIETEFSLASLSTLARPEGGDGRL